MPKARKHQISLEVTPYYHCTSRCVRRAFLCGRDRYTGKSYEHRREWVEERLLLLGQVFTIGICSYAVMSNHLHVVLAVDQPLAKSLTDKEVCARWHRLYQGTSLTQMFLDGQALSEGQQMAVDEKIEQWREHLFDISWFMRALNEPIARQANAEDKCKGRFWEGRFTSQAILGIETLLTCMAYVDLNPIRAGMADTPENSDHTSIKMRVEHLRKNSEQDTQPRQLMPFTGDIKQDQHRGIPFHLTDYLELLDWTGRSIRDDKRGAISNKQPAILKRLTLDEETWFTLATEFEDSFHILAGPPAIVRQSADHFNYQRAPRKTRGQILFS